MKKNTLLLYCALLLSAHTLNFAAETTTTSVEQNTKLSEKYTNDEKKYSIQYPTNWQKKDIPKLDLVLFAPPKNGTEQPHATMNVVSEIVGDSITLDQFYNESIANLTSQLKDINIESSGKVDLNGVSSKWVLYSHTMQNVKFKVMQYFIVEQGNVYLITFSALGDDFDEFRPIFEKIAASFTTLRKAGLISH